jgi:hypothetical protein
VPAFQALKPVVLYDRNCPASNAACGTLPKRLRHHGLPAPSSAAVCPAGPVRNGDAGNSGPAISPSTILDRAQRYGQICPTTITADAAPGSGCPRLRPPRRAALPMLAVMFVVASAPPWAAAIIVSASSPAAAARVGRVPDVQHGFLSRPGFAPVCNGGFQKQRFQRVGPDPCERHSQTIEAIVGKARFSTFISAVLTWAFPA